MTASSTTPLPVDSDTLASRAKAYGVFTSYTNAFDQESTVSDEALLAVLKSLDVDLSLPLTSQDRPWLETLPPVCVWIKGQDPFAVSLHWPQEKLISAINWRMIRESGKTHQGVWDIKDSVESRTVQTKSGQQALNRYQWNCPIDLPLGYHQVAFDLDDQTYLVHLIVTPDKAYLPKDKDQRFWGVSLQLYAQRSETNWGIGDFADLHQAAKILGHQGAGVLGLNPMHSMFPNKPEHISPYSPSSRLFYTDIYLDLQRTPEWEQSETAQALYKKHAKKIAQWKQHELVQYAPVLKLRREALIALFETFSAQANSERHAEFETFLAGQGEPLLLFATFQALSDYLDAQSGQHTAWWDWPIGYRTPDGADVQNFQHTNADQIRYYQFVQFLVHQQLAELKQATHDAGMSVGLYGDVAVGSDLSGADVWQNPSLYALDMTVGCPPDECNMLGQNWGLPAIRPDKLREQAYQPFIDLLRSNMAYFGALRLDHAMSVFRLFWIPQGMNGSEGTYVTYPLHDLLGILALESQRNQCIVIGEDLGTVPDEITEAFPKWGIHSYRLFVLEYQGDQKAYTMPSEYPSQALAMLSTHDLPTLSGFWEGEDIQTRASLNLFPNEAFKAKAWETRIEEKKALLRALRAEEVLDQSYRDGCTPALAQAVQRFLAKTPSRFLMCQLEDFFFQVPQVNLPGTVYEYPNWQRKISVPVEVWERDDNFLAISALLREERG